jgi:hypothetical protein
MAGSVHFRNLRQSFSGKTRFTLIFVRDYNSVTHCLAGQGNLLQTATPVTNQFLKMTLGREKALPWLGFVSNHFAM